MKNRKKKGNGMIYENTERKKCQMKANLYRQKLNEWLPGVKGKEGYGNMINIYIFSISNEFD